MDNSKDVREFLMSRRSRITPAQAGLPAYGGTRRVAGLKREEVAMLAGVSTEYYARLERGNLRGVSDSVLDSLASTLQLDEAERAHLLDLARSAAPSTAAGTRQKRQGVSPSVERLLTGMTGIPAYVRNSRMDILAANPLCFALYTGILGPGTLPLNLARFMFLDTRARDFFVEWETLADDLTAALRVEVGRHPHDRVLNALIGDLATGSDEFPVRWARHNVRFHRSARKTLRCPLIGEIELTGDALELPGQDLTLIAYTAEPGSHAQEQLDFLTSWSISQAGPQRAAAVDPVPNRDQPS
jgi:transcriptional regulator with XRE-family HTH domain